MDHITDWAIIAIFAANSVLTITQIGKERAPIAPGAASFYILINTIVIGIFLWSIVTDG